MSKSRQVKGGGTAVRVGHRRIAGWFDRFVDAHGGVASVAADERLMEVRAGDGVRATVMVPFPPMELPAGGHADLDTSVDALVRHMARPRRVGVILVRLGAHSVGVVAGGRVEMSSTDRHLVHGRNAAGGWSQQRFARRREGQARASLAAAAGTARRVLVPELRGLDAVVLGGDRKALESLRADPALAGLMRLAQPWVLDVPEPRRKVLDDAAIAVTEVEVVISTSG